MLVQGQTRKGPLGKVKVLLKVQKTRNGWSQRFLAFVDKDCFDPREGRYFNADYVSGEKLKNLKEWWKCDFEKLMITDDENYQIVDSVCQDYPCILENLFNMWRKVEKS